MSKSYVEELNRVYARIFDDARYAYPAMRAEFDKDQIRLSEFVKQRGIRAYCTDLPAVGKHLDRCLSNGSYKLSGLPMTGRFSGRVQIPKFLRGLYLRVFDEFGTLKGDYDVVAISFLRQILYAGKRAAIQCSEDAVSDEVRDFVLIDSTLPVPESFWNAEAPVAAEVSDVYAGFSKSALYRSRAGQSKDLSIFLATLDIVSSIVSFTLGPYRYGEWRFRHGPGAVSNLSGESNKYCWTNWSTRLENAFPSADCAFHNYAAWAGYISDSRLRAHLRLESGKEVDLGYPCRAPVDIDVHDPPSRLIDVPKTLTKPRLIAAEPSEHMWCQQNIWHYMDTMIKDSWISKFVRFRDQTRNQELCRRGSQSGLLATVDLSAASDRVTCHLVGQLFRQRTDLLLALQASRTRHIEIDPRHGVGERLELRKFSTMGSACTFPIETIAFMCVAISSVLARRRLKPTYWNVMALEEEVSIFGDDIIVPVDSRELLCEALELLHFKVNTSKSFWNGLFRESCGVDSYAGFDVTPAYWRAPYDGKPEGFASTVAVSNNFYEKFLVHTSDYLASTVAGDYEVPLIPFSSGYCGLKSFVDPSGHRSGMTRWNGGLQRMEAKVPALVVRVPKSPITDDSALLQFFSEDPSPFSFWAGGVAERPELKVKLRWVSVEDLGTPVSEGHGQYEFMGIDSKSGLRCYKVSKPCSADA